MSSRISTRPVLVLVALVFVGLPSVAPVSGQRLDRTRFVQWAYQDAGALARDFTVRTPLVALGGAFLLEPGARLDAHVLEEVQEGYRGPLADMLNATNGLGESRMLPVAGGVFAVTLLTRSERLQDAAFTSLEALVYARALTGVLKGLVGRYRPEAGAGAHRFDPFSGNRSFPSGHTTVAFALLTPWVFYYPGPATYGLFALGVGTAAARIALDKHWPTDVLAGAAIGFFTARYLVRRHQADAPDAPDIRIQPVVGLGIAGVRLSLSFQ